MDAKIFTLTCPHCGKSHPIEVFDFYWYDSEYQFYSDTFIIGEKDGVEWCTPRYTMLCPECGHYFATPIINGVHIAQYAWPRKNKLSFMQLKEALKEFKGSGVQEINCRLELWWAFYNLNWTGYSGYSGGRVPPTIEAEFHHANMLWLLKRFSRKKSVFSTLVFELNRQLGRIDVCKRMIEDFTFERFVAQKKAKWKKIGFQHHYSEDDFRFSYDLRIKELEYALEQNPLPYIKNLSAVV